MPQTFLQRHRLAGFYVLALAIVCGVMAVALVTGAAAVIPALFAFLEAEEAYPNAVSIARFSLGEPAGWLILVFAAAPTIAALVVCAATGGRDGLKRLLARLKPWRTAADRAAGLRAWAVLLAAGVLGTLAYLYVALAVAPPQAGARVLVVLGTAPLAVAGALLVGPFLDEGGLLEELGWRGFALPELVAGGHGALPAALTVGALWWAWHLPREVATVLSGAPLPIFAVQQGLFLLLCLAMSVVIMPFWIRTGGSAMVGVFVHGLTNVWSKALGAPMYDLTGTDVRTWIVVGAAVVVLAVYGPGLGTPRSGGDP